jgi:hypothetical protein
LIRNSETPLPTGFTSPAFPAARRSTGLNARPCMNVAQAVEPPGEKIGLANFDH